MKQKLVLTAEMKDAYNSIKGGNNTIILGVAGSGKSTFIRYLANNGLRIIKLAPTGVSAFNIGGSTAHRFFGFPPRLIETNKVAPVRSWIKLELLQNCDGILIDEVSMVRSDMMDGIDASLRLTMQNDIPFGGIPMIFMGDLGQLSPVVGHSAEKEYFKYNYKSEFFFDSKVFVDADNAGFINSFNFTKVFRQTDPVFIDYLHKIRFGTISVNEIEEINDICYGKPKTDEIVVCSRNADVDRYNSSSMYELDTQEETFTAIVDGDFKVENCNVDRLIVLKVGARVMMMMNNAEQNYYNGSMGTYIGKGVTDVEEKPCLMVKMDKENESDEETIVMVTAHKYANVEQKYNKSTNSIDNDPKGFMIQYPIKLAFAISVHKTQGLSFNKVSIDMGHRGAFVHGQLYVALSRCRSLEGLRLSRRISKSDVIIDHRVKGWLEQNDLVI